MARIFLVPSKTEQWTRFLGTWCTCGILLTTYIKIGDSYQKARSRERIKPNYMGIFITKIKPTLC